MTAFLLTITLINYIIFKNNWKRLVYFFIYFLPYIGFIQLKISDSVFFAPLIHDIIFIIPIYIIFVTSKKNINFLPMDLKKLIYIFIFFLFIQFLNPFNNLGFWSRIIGLKIWILYFFLIAIGYHLISNKKDLKKFCNTFTICAIIPCLIGNFLYILFAIYGHRETLILFYNDFGIASAASQNFAKFDYGSFSYYRNPSTFTYSAQYLNFCLLALITTITSISISETLKEKSFYKFVLVLIIISLFFTGNRASIIILPIFFSLFILQNYKIADIKFGLFKFIIIIIVAIFLYKNLSIISSTTTLAQTYTESVFFDNFEKNISKYFFGIGLGNSTSGARYLGNLNMINEGYYWKVIVELGVPGLIIVMSLFLNYLKQVKIVKIKIMDFKEKILCNSFYAYIIFQLIFAFKSWVYFDGYPANIIFFLLLGIILKIGTNEYIKNSHD